MGGNEAVFRRIIEECFNDGNLRVLEELIAPDFVEHQQPFATLAKGPDAFALSVTLFRTMVPDLHIEIQDLTESDDVVWARMIGTGTHTVPIFGRKPTGKPMVIDAVDIVRFTQRKAVEHWGVADLLTCLTQIGALDFGPPREVPL